MLGIIASRWFSSTRSETETPLSNSEYHEPRGFSDAVRRSTTIVEFSLEGTILSANEKLLHLAGYRLGEIEGRNHRFLLDSEQADSPNFARCWESLRLGQAVEEQFPYITKHGRPLHLQGVYNPLLGADGRPTKIVAILNDITQLVGDKQSTDQAAYMLDNIPLNVMFADRDLVILYINRSSRETLTKLRGLLPISVDQIVGAEIDQFHQRRLLADPNNLPVKTQFPLGPETIELMVHPVFDSQQNYVGAAIEEQSTIITGMKATAEDLVHLSGQLTKL
ncbi:PAS domain-containing protein [Blastopirellula retiformator]|uniref:Biofilm dispersion protein BdlA n=1 Tax=Blastopirellula retiformator TaxID=2527970 RepID=A0A5C5VMQ3_9BACT|nr:PAS domain-containing protein [Blastopirellula retiformator]TWT39181.1 Biofilm dispersion protein BdlA [Blastopirellula retiformator]